MSLKKYEIFISDSTLEPFIAHFDDFDSLLQKIVSKFNPTDNAVIAIKINGAIIYSGLSLLNLNKLLTIAVKTKYWPDRLGNNYVPI